MAGNRFKPPPPPKENLTLKGKENNCISKQRAIGEKKSKRIPA